MQLAQLEKLLSEAQECNTSLNRLVCTGFVKNQCGCSVAVDLPGSEATKKYVAAVEALKPCAIACPAIICSIPTVARCDAPGGGIIGRCVGVLGNIL
jgi:hypothetical protein